MIALLALPVLNVLFLAVTGLSYLFVARRREKVRMLLDHLAALARQGMPLPASLKVVGQDVGGYFGTRIARAARRIEEGRTLAEAFQDAPRTFPPFLRSMLVLGERSGNPAAFLDEAARSTHRAAERSRDAIYVFMYPVMITLCINLGITSVILGIAPNLKAIIQQVNGDSLRYELGWVWLAGATEGVLVFCILFMVAILLGGGSAHFGSTLLRWLKRPVDWIVLRLPVVGGLVRDSAVHQLSVGAGLFLKAGARLDEALSGAAAAERNGVLARRIARVAARAAEGERLSTAARAEGLPADFLWFVETGEAAGCLPDHLLLAASYYEGKVRFLARAASHAMIPFFLLLNGLLVLGTFLLITDPMTSSLRRVVPW